jgi:hypothetical protein
VVSGNHVSSVNREISAPLHPTCPPFLASKNEKIGWWEFDFVPFNGAGGKYDAYDPEGI